jgi:branched-chain amino acid transport system ATP-binding protein
VDGLEVAYGEMEVVHGVSLRVDPGEAIAILGANGAGKTTLLRAISGLLRPRGGKVTFGGSDLTKARPNEILRHGIAHVPQGRQVFTEQTVHENLLLGSRLRKDRDAVERDRSYVLQVFPALREKLKERAGSLSGGQQQALAIARGLMSAPSLLLLDEPSLGLSPRLVDELLKLLKTVKHDRKMGLLLVEQDALLALELTDRAYVLQRGKTILEASSDSLIGDPKVVFAYLGGEMDHRGPQSDTLPS